MDNVNMLELLFGKNKTMELLNKWKNMSEEERQRELNKIKGIPQDKLKQCLINFGFDPKWLENIPNNNMNTERRFNY